MTAVSHAALALRLATAEDAALVTYHRRRMFEDIGGTDRAKLDAMDAAFEPWVRDKLAAGEYLGWFAVDGDRVVSGAGLWLTEWPPGPVDVSGRRGVIYNVYTEPEYRRRGLARQVVTALLDWCRANGLQTVILHASSEGRPLYRSLGFKATNEMRITL